jgi:UDP-N-acetylmuramate--alanine ligase
VKKRSEILGLIIKDKTGIAVAGTHGKTTVSTMIAHLLHASGTGCNAFLGGISKNYTTNYIINANSNKVVVEADEFDRSFLRLFPRMAVITAMDADHLDIYEDANDLEATFHQFIAQIKPKGILIHKLGLPIETDRNDITILTYSLDNPEADYYAKNIQLTSDGRYEFTLAKPQGEITNLTLHQRGLVNVENAVAACAIALQNKVSAIQLQESLSEFNGIWRRFEYHINTNKMVYIDDYAHHPEELKATITSVRDIYKKKKITGIFQPHLYSRTKDFAPEFAESLSLLDEVILTDIYPAREEPIPGVDANIIFKDISQENKTLCTKNEIIDSLKKNAHEVVLSLGAGDIDKEIETIKTYLLSQ